MISITPEFGWGIWESQSVWQVSRARFEPCYLQNWSV